MKNLHEGQPLSTTGPSLDTAQSVVVLLHGRGASASSILTLAEALDVPGVAYLAPEAANSSWYPYHFQAPLQDNEPWISSALSVVENLEARIKAAGVAQEHILIMGFSRGACLSLEYAARHAGRYGGVAALSGGLVGPPGTPRKYPGSLKGTPVLIGCSDRDPFIPKESVEEAAHVLGRMGAQVTLRIYPDMGHTVNADELALVRKMLSENLQIPEKKTDTSGQVFK